jgi:hypothetical protein
VAGSEAVEKALDKCTLAGYITLNCKTAKVDSLVAAQKPKRKEDRHGQ